MARRPSCAATVSNDLRALPASLAAGRYRLVVHNTNATNSVEVDFFMTPAGTAAADAEKFYSDSTAASGTMPDLFYKVTIPGGVTAPPNGTADAIIDLQPGDRKSVV